MVLPLRGSRGGGDRDAALLLLLHPVHHRRALVDLADLVRAPGVVQNALGRRRLTGVDVRHDPDIPGVLEGELTWHGSGWNRRVVSRAGFERWLELVTGCFQAKKWAPRAHARAAGLIWTGSRRYLLEVSILVGSLRGHARTTAPPAKRGTTIAEQSERFAGRFGSSRPPSGPRCSPSGADRDPRPEGHPRRRRRDARAHAWRRADRPYRGREAPVPSGSARPCA